MSCLLVGFVYLCCLVWCQILFSRNGELSFQEYVGLRGQDKDKEWLIEEKDRFDNELDKNGDNVLNKDEILAWIIPSNEEIAKEEVIR